MRLTVVATLIVLGFVVFGLTVFLRMPLEVTAHHEEDELYFEKGSGTMLHVHCPTGVGSATVKLVDEHWHGGFEVRLHLSALEGFAVRTANEVHRIGINSEGTVVVEPADSYVLHLNELQAFEKAGTFSVSVYPENFAESVSEIQLEWVDYYR